MTNKNIANLIKGAPALSPDDNIRRAVGLIRTCNSSSLLVISYGQVIGTVTEQSIAAYLAQAEDIEVALSTRVEPLITQGVTLINSSATQRQAAELFAASGTDVLPVIDNSAMFLGVLYRRDLVGLMTRNLRPPTVAGMATPLGVYLTTGAQSGGAGSFGLFLTGASLMLMMTIATLSVDGLVSLLSKLTRMRFDLYIAYPPSTGRFTVFDLVLYGAVALTLGLTLLLLRLSPLAGFHGAEHMTVHAIEAGEELSPDIVRHMPRVHPRCGTNLLAGAGLFMIITSKLSGDFAVLLAMLVVFFGWRTIGGWMQYYATTKIPNEKQLANGVAAGNELLDKYMDDPNHRVTGYGRVWNMGFIQTSGGMAAMFGILSLLQMMLKIRLTP